MHGGRQVRGAFLACRWTALPRTGKQRRIAQRRKHRYFGARNRLKNKVFENRAFRAPLQQHIWRQS
jgi:hypothetical protein